MMSMDEQTVQPETVVKPDEQRVAAYLWTLLDKPDEFNNEETRVYWSREIRECMNSAQYDRVAFKKFLEWVLNDNAYSVEYMRNAKDPVKTLKKNLPTLLKLYGNHQKALAALEKSKNKLKKNNLPKYRQDSGKDTILTGDV